MASRGKRTTVPYKQVDNGHVTVNGLPAGFMFKKPSNCSQVELKILKENMQHISFTGKTSVIMVKFLLAVFTLVFFIISVIYTAD